MSRQTATAAGTVEADTPAHWFRDSHGTILHYSAMHPGCRRDEAIFLLTLIKNAGLLVDPARSAAVRCVRGCTGVPCHDLA